MSFNVPAILTYMSVIAGNGTPYNYSAPPFDIDNAATWFDNITWTDGRTKPTINDLFDYQDNYELWWETKLRNDLDTTAAALPTTKAYVADAATNAQNNAPTNLTVLSILSNEVNATNAKQNDLANKYNDLAGKFNTLLDRLKANKLIATS